MTGHDDTLYLIDGPSYIYRAYFAIRHLSSPGGHPTNAIYGFIQMLQKLIKDHNPRHLAVVFDAGRVTFRTGLYPDYKANRAAMPEDLRQQVGPIREVVRAFNIPALELEGFEADDIIGTLAARYTQTKSSALLKYHCSWMKSTEQFGKSSRQDLNLSWITVSICGISLMDGALYQPSTRMVTSITSMRWMLLS